MDAKDIFIMPMDYVMIPAQIIFSVLAVYFFILGIAGLFQTKSPKNAEPKQVFAVIVPAHNEEMVIGPLVENITTVNYPKELFDVFVIADNATDQTAKIAAEHGAIVYERFDTTQRGKGYALEWFFNILYQLPKKYDAVVILDADNLVDASFLRHMNNRLCDGHKIIQGYIDAKNPLDTWVTASFAMFFWVSNRMLQLARYNLGLCNYLGGTGMAISLDVLREIGWGATSLTEDLEFSLKALLRGYKTTLAFEAIVYDEKPLTFRQAWNQRRRWALGHVQLFRMYSLEFIKQVFIKRRFIYLDATIVSIQPLLVIFMGIFIAISFMDALVVDIYTPIFNKIWPPMLWELVITLQLLNPFLVMWVDNLPRKVFKWIPIHYLLFMYSWIFIVFISFFRKTSEFWSHTLHTRNIGINDITRNR